MRVSSTYISGLGGVFEGGSFGTPPRLDNIGSPFSGTCRGSLMTGMGGMGQFELYTIANNLVKQYDSMVARAKKLDPSLLKVFMETSDELTIGRRIDNFRIGEITQDRVDKIGQRLPILENRLRELEAAATPDEIVKVVEKKVVVPKEVIKEVEVEKVIESIPTYAVVGGLALAGVAGYFIYKHFSKK